MYEYSCPWASVAGVAVLFCSHGCDTFSLPFFHTFDVILPSLFSPSVPSMPFTLCLSMLHLSSALEYSAPLTCLFPLAPQNCSTGLVTLVNMSKAHRVSIAILGTIHIVSTMWEVGSVISSSTFRIPRAGKHLPMAYDFAFLQAINAKSLVSFLHNKTKSMLRAAGCFCSNMKCGF